MLVELKEVLNIVFYEQNKWKKPYLATTSPPDESMTSCCSERLISFYYVLVLVALLSQLDMQLLEANKLCKILPLVYNHKAFILQSSIELLYHVLHTCLV